VPPKGRPRLTEDDLQARIGAYCRAFGVSPGPKGLPPFPSGKRETPQHREWISLYKLWSRLGRRQRGQCERCDAPIVEGSVFCEEHRAATPSPAKLSQDQRNELLASQGGRCPICLETIDLLESVAATHGQAPLALVHPGCNRLLGLAEAAGQQTLERVRAQLWPKTPKGRPR
jgi:hypothetical protein